MSEVEKLYENTGVKKLLYCDICKAQEYALGLCAETKCEPFYPPFTAEKQLELIKWLSHWGVQIGSNKEKTLFEVRIAMKYIISSGNDFTNCLANTIIQLWQDLSDTEKAEIKRILE